MFQTVTADGPPPLPHPYPTQVQTQLSLIAYGFNICKSAYLQRLICGLLYLKGGFPGGASGKESACQFRRHNETQIRSLGWEDPLEVKVKVAQSCLTLCNLMEFYTVHGIL